ncbi:MAG: recombination regulator RecX [Clostridiales bacterium]|jgi:regulatory protein|nr:recombination regulator RecX [Clostridiales bacterium]
MIITDIKPQIKNTKRFSIFIDGEFAFGISGEDLLWHKLEIGQNLHRDDYDKLLNQLEFAAARDAAVRNLSRSPKSIAQLREKLAEKEFSPNSIEKVIDLLCERNYLNDTEFAISFISHKAKISNFGRNRIERELRQKGVAQRDIDAAYAQFGGEDEEAAIRRALAKKLRNKNPAEIAADPKELARLKGFLARRGFDFDTIDKILAAFSCESPTQEGWS